MKTTRIIKLIALAIISMSIPNVMVAQPRNAAQNNRAPRASEQRNSPSNNARPNDNAKPAPKPDNHRAAPHNSAPQREVGRARTSTNNSHMRVEHINPTTTYHKMPRKGQVVHQSHVNKARQIHYSGRDYYYRNGVFYFRDGVDYRVTKAPIGVRISLLPEPRLIWVNNIQYYYYFGTYYRYIELTREYEVVTPPVGAIVESIPDGYETVVINGETYYIVDDAQYKAVIYNGEIWYEVIKVN